MQTFLPYPSFVESARVLDSKRLGKQRVECLQILKALTNIRYGWQYHPAVRMWRGHGLVLVEYGYAVCAEWVGRGYADSCWAKLGLLAEQIEQGQARMPPWLGDPMFHASHRSNLLRKDPEHYGEFGWSEGIGLAYVWPRSSLGANAS